MSSVLKGLYQASPTFIFIFSLFFLFSSTLFAQEGSVSKERKLFELGQRHVELGEMDEAIEAFLQVIQGKPDHFPSYLILGMIYSQTNKLDLAIEAFENAIKLRPDLLDAHLNLGVIYSQMNKFDLAIDALENAIKLRPDILEGHLLLAQAYSATGRLVEAEASAKKAIAINPSHARSHFILGRIYLEQKRSLEAIEEYRMVLTLRENEDQFKEVAERLSQFKKVADIHFKTGLQYFKEGKLDEALEEFQKVLALSRSHPVVHYYIGLIHNQKNQLDLAKESFLAALESTPDFFKARLHLGQVYEHQGFYVRAIQEFQIILDEIGDQKREEAIHAKQKLTQLGSTPEIGEKVKSHLDKADDFMDQGALDEAEGEFREILAILPSHVYSHYNLGQIALERGEIDLAETLFHEAIEIDPNHYLSLLRLGVIAETRIPKRPLFIIINKEAHVRYQAAIKKAIEAYRKLASVPPLGPFPTLRIAVLYEQSGSHKEAIELYKKVLSFKGSEEQLEGRFSRGRIDYLESRFRVSFNDTFLTYDSNSRRESRPQLIFSEISSNIDLGISYFLVKTERFRLPIQLNIRNQLFHRQQSFFNNEDLAISFITKTSSQFIFMQGYKLSYGFEGGTDRLNQSSYKMDTFTGQIAKQGRFPTLVTLNFDYILNKSLLTPILDATRQIAKLSFDQNLSIKKQYLGKLQLSYSFFDNDVVANDLAYRSNTYSLGYELVFSENIKWNLRFIETRSKFRNPDSLAQTLLERTERRENRYTAWSIGLTYQLQPGFTLYANFLREKNRSNLPAFSFDAALLESGQVTALGPYQRTAVTFGASFASDLRVPYPQWSKLGKRISIGLITGYYRPSLNNLDEIMANPNLVIPQDPNNLIPSNPGLRSEERNLSVPEIKGAVSTGIEVEWEIKPKNALVFNLVEWQNSSTSQDTIPLLLAPNVDPVMVPRSARYNLVINQYLLGWRYAFWDRPEEGRFYLNTGLGLALANFTIDSLVKVEDPPGFDPIVSFGSMEARGTGFITRIGFGGEYFLSSWFSIGLNANYLYGTVRKLTVERGFPADFQNQPEGLPGIFPSSCFRQVDVTTEGEVAEVAICEEDQELNPLLPGQRRNLTLRLDGFDVQAAIRFHFGRASGNGTVVDQLMNGKRISDGSSGLWQKIGSRFSMSGYLKNETAYRIFDPVTFTKILYLFRLNTTFSFSKRYHITTSIRTFYDAIYDLIDIDTISPRRFPDTVLTQIPQQPTSEEVASVEVENSRDVEIVKDGFEFRETYFDINTRWVDMRIGRQIARWGVVEGSRVVDELNPFDFSEFILREIEDRFIPLMMVRTKFYPGQYTFDLVWITEIVPHKPAPVGSEFEQLEVLPGFVPPDSFLDSSLNLNKEAFENTEVGARLIRNFGGWELSLSAFYTWDDFPSSFRIIEGASDNPFNNTVDTAFMPEQKRLKILGTTLSKSFGKVVINSEFSYTFDKFFGTRLEVGGLNQGVELGELQRDYIKYAVGFDFILFKTDFSLQFLESRIFDWQAPILQDEVDSVASFFVRKPFFNDRMSTQLLVLYFINEDDYLIRPRLDNSITDTVKFRFGGDFFIGTRGVAVGEFDFIGFFNDSDRLYFEFIYSF